MKKKHKKNISAGIASAMALGTVVVATPIATEASASFSDVKATDHYYNAVGSLAERGIIKGFSDGTFKPGQSVTRGQAAKIIAGILELDTKNVVNPGFKDVPTTHEYYGAIAALANAGIIKGYGDGTFGLGKTVQRNHMAKMIAGAFKLEAPAGSTTPFKDVSAKSEYSSYISALYAAGITTGTTKTTFSGTSNVTRGQLASFVVRAETVASPDVPTTEEVTFTIDAVKKNTVGGYKISNAVKVMLNEKNNEALSDALVSVNVRNNEIIAVNSIELNAAGTAEKAIVFDGANSTIEGNLTINADYVEVKNVTVKGDVSITGNVVNAFSADGLVSEGQITIEEGSDALASLVPLFANNQQGPKVSLKNSEVKNVNVKRDGVTLESDTKLGEVQISAKVSSIQLDASSGKIVIDVAVSLEITGKGTIDEVQLVKAIELALEISGAIGKLTVSDSNAKVEVATSLIINSIEVAKGTDIKDIVKNYDQIKENIKEIVEAGQPTTPGTTPGTPGTTPGTPGTTPGTPGTTPGTPGTTPGEQFKVTTNSDTANNVATLGLEGTSAESNSPQIATVKLAEGKVKITSASAGTATITINNAHNQKATIEVVVNSKGAIEIKSIKKYEKEYASNSVKALNGLVANANFYWLVTIDDNVNLDKSKNYIIKIENNQFNLTYNVDEKRFEARISPEDRYTKEAIEGAGVLEKVEQNEPIVTPGTVGEENGQVYDAVLYWLVRIENIKNLDKSKKYAIKLDSKEFDLTYNVAEERFEARVSPTKNYTKEDIEGASIITK